MIGRIAAGSPFWPLPRFFSVELPLTRQGQGEQSGHSLAIKWGCEGLFTEDGIVTLRRRLAAFSARHWGDEEGESKMRRADWPRRPVSSLFNPVGPAGCDYPGPATSSRSDRSAEARAPEEGGREGRKPETGGCQSRTAQWGARQGCWRRRRPTPQGGLQGTPLWSPVDHSGRQGVPTVGDSGRQGPLQAFTGGTLQACSVARWEQHLAEPRPGSPSGCLSL